MTNRIKKCLWIFLMISSIFYFAQDVQAISITRIKLLVNKNNIHNTVSLSKYLTNKKDTVYLQTNKTLGSINQKTGKYKTKEQEKNFIYAIRNHKIQKIFQIESIRWAAHRGYSGRFCENTDTAFIQAAKHGADIIETDIRMSKDGILYCYHDTYISPKTNGKGRLKNLTSKEINKLRYKKQNKTICTFEKYLQICKKYRITPWIHIKPCNDDVHNRQTINKIVQTLKKNNWQNKIGFANDGYGDMAKRRMNNKYIHTLKRKYNDFSPLTNR